MSSSEVTDVPPSQVMLDADQFPHLTRIEWAALHRLADSAGEAVVVTLLRSGDADAQRMAAHEFLERELAEAQRQRQAPASSGQSTQVVKLDISSYSGEERERVPLRRWFTEVDMAICGRRLRDEQSKVMFMVSKLSGKAKQWALGRRAMDVNCFPTLVAAKEELRTAFEPPHDEFRLRTEFLGIKQGRASMRDYVQKARELVACIVSNPIDMATQVHTFLTGTRDGPIKNHLFRHYPDTLEDAFALALREDYCASMARMHSYAPPPPAPTPVSEPEPMEIDALGAERRPYTGAAPVGSGRGGVRSRVQRTPQDLVCYRCRKRGHRAAECRAPAPVLASVEAVGGDTNAQLKNGNDQ